MGGESASPIVCVTMRPPFITPRPLPTLRRGVRIRKFWCPVSGGFPPDHLLPGAMGHRSLHCLGAGPAQDPRPPIQAPPACQASSQHNYHDPGFQIHIDATQLVPCFPTVFGHLTQVQEECMKYSEGSQYTSTSLKHSAHH